MEFASLANLFPHPQMEPIQHLAPYLTDLNVADAIESFNELADSLMLHEESSQLRPSTCPSSPSSLSDCSSSYKSYTSQDNNQTHRSCWSSSASVASSYQSSNKSSSAGRRRRKNANAAEKYRKKLKGIDCRLIEQMDREMERNSHLRRDLSHKLSLYRELVSLLARNVDQSDLHLASLGFRSVSSVVSVCSTLEDYAPNNQDEADNDLLEQLHKFQHILSTSSRF